MTGNTREDCCRIDKSNLFLRQSSFVILIVKDYFSGHIETKIFILPDVSTILFENHINKHTLSARLDL